MKKVSHRLQTDESLEKEIFIFGLVSSAKDFRLSWMINNHLGFNLEKVGQINIPAYENLENMKKQQSMFSEEEHEPVLPKDYSVNPVYHFAFDLFYSKVFLLVNQGSLKWLVPDLKTMDYFLLIKGPMPGIELKNILKQLKEIPVITMAVSMELNQIPAANREYFIHDNYGTLDKN
jgi:hypothetical protein